MIKNTNSSLVVKNTIMLYFRQILIMLVSLYTVRVVLNVLGAEDYGIYNVVAGVVTMFGFISGAMATASQRYFSFDLGKNDIEHLKITFNVTFQIYIILALIIITLAETLGVWFVNHWLVIPLERMTAANWIFQAAIVSFLLTLITTPYMACIIAHENMNVYAYVSIIETGLKLGIVFLLKVLPYDKLAVYGLLLSAVALINTSIYRLYCHKHYVECKLHFVKDKALFKEIISYSGWNLFGASVGVVKNQIINILLNMSFGAVVNAARAVASQVNSAVTSFSHNFSTALRPQIIKTYAAEQKDECKRLVYRGCRFTFYLMYIFALPLILEMDIILKFWLKNPPEFAVIFTRLALIDAVIDSISFPLMTIAQATGKIKFYQGVVGGILLCNLPVSYIVLKLGAPAYSVMIIAICITFFAFIVRLFIVRKLAGLSIKQFITNTAISCVVVAVISAVIPVIICFNMDESWLRFLIVGFISVLCTIISVLYIGMTKIERIAIVEKVKSKISRNAEC